MMHVDGRPITVHTLTAEQVGTLVVHQLNELWGYTCCPHCCAPCGVIEQLEIDNALDRAVLCAPDDLVRGRGWWNADGRFVDREWLYSRWVCGDETSGHRR